MKLVVLVCLVFLVSACTGTGHKILNSSEDYTVVEAGSNDTYSSLAQRYLGDARLGSVLARYNPQRELEKGSQVLIPLKNPNPSGVFSNGYQRIPILCYHQFTEHKDKRSSMVVYAGDFDRQMRFLAENGYQVIPLKDVRPFLEGHKPLPDKAVAITIDDGYRSYFEVAYPILKKYGFASTMFIYPDFIGGGVGLSWEQVKILDEDSLVDIQSHSKSHASLSPLPEGEEAKVYTDRLKKEVETTDKILTNKLGRPANHFAYPYGDSSQELVSLLEQNEYEMALTVKKGGNPAFAYPYLLRRTMVYGKGSFKTFQRHLDVFKKTDLK